MWTAERLRRLGPDGIAQLIEVRPDVVGPVMPLSLHEVAARLAQPDSVFRALTRVDLPTAQVAEALAHLGEAADRADLIRFLRLTGDDERAALDRCLATLQALGLVDEAGTPAPALAGDWRHPLGLGPRLQDILENWTVARLAAALVAWGERPSGRKRDHVAALAGVLTDGPRLRRALEDAPAFEREALQAAVDAPGSDGTVDLSHIDWRGRIQGGTRWLATRGITVQEWGGEVVVPAEVLLALRGEAWRPPFDWRPPPVTWVPVDQALVDREAAAAAGRTLRLLTSLVRDLSTRPATLNRDGTLGVREIKRLAKALGAPPGEVRFAVALAFTAALLAHTEDALAPTPDADAWLASPPADRQTLLLRAWSRMLQVPLARPDAPWHPMPDRAWGSRRFIPLELQATQPEHAPTDLTDLVRVCLWLTPERTPSRHTSFTGRAVHRDDDTAARDEVTGVLAEAALLGLTGTQAVSSLGLAVVEGDDPRGVLVRWFGRPLGTARLQGDLTAAVLGDPSARLAGVLDALGDRETRDQAVTWRFSERSVARALDTGRSADDLLAALAAVADDDVPQPLEYLVRDTARRHGTLRAGAAASYVRSDDHARLAEAAADSRLRHLGLRLLAPGVLVSERALDDTLARLRAAGYLPVHEDGSGAVVVPDQNAVRAEVSDFVRSLAPPDQADDEAREIAEAMLELPDRGPAPLMPIHGTVIDSRSLREVFDPTSDS